MKNALSQMMFVLGFDCVCNVHFEVSNNNMNLEQQQQQQQMCHKTVLLLLAIAVYSEYTLFLGAMRSAICQ